MLQNQANPAQNVPLSAAQIEVMAKANQMAQNGNAGGAAPLFAELARELDAPHPRRAAIIHARAAHTYADSGNAQLSLAQARAALTMFIQYQMVGRAPIFYTNILRKYTNRGMPGAASAVQTEFGAKIGALPPASPTPAQAPGRRGALPTNCPKCGGPVHSDSTSWVDNQTAECEYCGTLMRATANPQ